MTAPSRRAELSPMFHVKPVGEPPELEASKVRTIPAKGLAEETVNAASSGAPVGFVMTTLADPCAPAQPEFVTVICLVPAVDQESWIVLLLELPFPPATFHVHEPDAVQFTAVAPKLSC